MALGVIPGIAERLLGEADRCGGNCHQAEQRQAAAGEQEQRINRVPAPDGSHATPPGRACTAAAKASPRSA